MSVRMEHTDIQRELPLQAYVANVSTYLKLMHPDIPNIEQKVLSWVSDKCIANKQRMNQAIQNINYRDDHGKLQYPTGSPEVAKIPWPMAEVIDYTSYGNIEHKNLVDLIEYTKQHRSDVLSPFGSCYRTADELPSTLKGMITILSKQRKTEKKLMLAAKQQNDKTAADYHNNRQYTIKVIMNSLIGAMGSGYSFLSNVANFNSVTSIARYFIMTSYAFTERFLESNFYIRTLDQAINHIVTCYRLGPDDTTILDILQKYNLYIPDVDTVYNFIDAAIRRYNYNVDTSTIRVLLSKLSTARLAFVFYMDNLVHLLRYNESTFRPIINDVITPLSLEQDTTGIDLNDIYKFDGDLLIVLATIYHEYLPVNDKGNSISILDCVGKDDELVKKFVIYGRYVSEKLSSIDDILNLIVDHRVHIAYVDEHKQMFRQCVILSDTDSVIFTTQNWVKWLEGNMRITDRSLAFNSLLVYWLSKSIVHVMYRLSTSFGAQGDDRKAMKMKNEFMMPVQILTTQKKHYANITKIQEGVFFGKPALDIKGVILRGSNYSQPVLEYTTKFIEDTIQEIYTTGKVSVIQKIREVLLFESSIRKSLKNQEVKFLPIKPIKYMNEYKNPDISIYWNYQVYERILASTYGHILVPTKCYIVPLTTISPKYLEWLATVNDVMYRSLTDLLQEMRAKHDRHPISRLPINSLSNVIPKELIPIVDYKSLIYSNTTPLYLILSSLGVGCYGSKVPTLLSETYGWVEE